MLNEVKVERTFIKIGFHVILRISRQTKPINGGFLHYVSSSLTLYPEAHVLVLVQIKLAHTIFLVTLSMIG